MNIMFRFFNNDQAYETNPSLDHKIQEHFRRKQEKERQEEENKIHQHFKEQKPDCDNRLQSFFKQVNDTHIETLSDQGFDKLQFTCYFHRSYKENDYEQQVYETYRRDIQRKIYGFIDEHATKYSLNYKVQLNDDHTDRMVCLSTMVQWSKMGKTKINP